MSGRGIEGEQDTVTAPPELWSWMQNPEIQINSALPSP